MDVAEITKNLVKSAEAMDSVKRSNAVALNLAKQELEVRSKALNADRIKIKSLDDSIATIKKYIDEYDKSSMSALETQKFFAAEDEKITKLEKERAYLSKELLRNKISLKSTESEILKSYSDHVKNSELLSRTVSGIKTAWEGTIKAVADATGVSATIAAFNSLTEVLRQGNRDAGSLQKTFQDILAVQIATGTTAAQNLDALRAMYAVGLDNDANFKSTLSTVIKLRDGLGVSAQAAANLALSAKVAKANFGATVDIVASIAKYSALTAEEATTFASEFQKGLRGLDPKNIQGATEAVLALGAAYKDVGANQQDIFGLIQSINKEGDLSKAAILGINDALIGTPEAANQIQAKLVEINKMAEGQGAAGTQMLKVWAAQLGVTIDTLRAAGQANEQYNANLLKVKETQNALSDAYNKSMSGAGKNIEQLINSLTSLAMFAVAPLVMWIQKAAEWVNRAVQSLMEFATQSKVVFGVLQIGATLISLWVGTKLVGAFRSFMSILPEITTLIRNLGDVLKAKSIDVSMAINRLNQAHMRNPSFIGPTAPNIPAPVSVGGDKIGKATAIVGLLTMGAGLVGEFESKTEEANSGLSQFASILEKAGTTLFVLGTLKELGVFSKIAPLLRGLVPVLTGFGTALSGIVAAISWPVVAITAAIVAAVAALVTFYNSCEKFRDFVNGTVDALKSAVKGVTKYLSDVIDDIDNVWTAREKLEAANKKNREELAASFAKNAYAVANSTQKMAKLTDTLEQLNGIYDEEWKANTLADIAKATEQNALDTGLQSQFEAGTQKIVVQTNGTEVVKTLVDANKVNAEALAATNQNLRDIQELQARHTETVARGKQAEATQRQQNEQNARNLWLSMLTSTPIPAVGVPMGLYNAFKH